MSDDIGDSPASGLIIPLKSKNAYAFFSASGLERPSAYGRMIYRDGKDPKRLNMCGRYSLLCIDDLGNRFRVYDPVMGLRSRFNVVPGDEMPVIVRSSKNEVARMCWGLIPHWTKDIRTAARSINARAESLAEKPSFRPLIRTGRCLVPASGFYEWKKEWGRRAPFYFSVPESPLFAFAGLYDCWQNPGGAALVTYTIITCEPNALVREIHARMPAILRREDEDRWLSQEPPGREELTRMLSPYPAQLMEKVAVSDLVNDPQVDDERLVQPVVSHTGTQTTLR